MKKYLFLLLFLMTATSSFAQFEQGKKYLSASFSGLDLSYDDTQKFHMGLNLAGGYFLYDDVMVAGQVGLDYGYESWREFSMEFKCKYYIEQNGLALSAGFKYSHLYRNYNDIAFTPEISYCYFLSRNLTVEPAVYYDMSINDFSHHSKAGVRLGFGIYF